MRIRKPFMITFKNPSKIQLNMYIIKLLPLKLLG